MITENLLGWFTLFLLLIVTFFIFKKYPKTKNFLIVAIFLRSLFVILDQYFMALPDSTGDAIIFEHKAFFYSEKYGMSIIFNLFSQDSFFISKFISIFYTLLDRSDMMAKMFSVGFGTASVFLIYRLTFILWGSHAASKAGWFAALFPSLILYSSLILREVYVIFFLTYALINCVYFLDKGKITYFIKIFFGFFIASLFHGPMILGFFIFLIYIIFRILKKNNYFLYFKKKNLYLFFLIPILLIPIIAFFLGYYSIPKIGNINNIGNFKGNDKSKVGNIEDIIIWKINKATKSSINNDSGASYPLWTRPNDMKEIIYLTPVRMIYFLYAPFPWDVKRFKHLVGLFDAIFYIYLSLCILQNRKILLEDSRTRFLIIILIMYVFAYSFGVGNFGTGTRHRLKFIGILIAIAAPKIARIKFSKIK